ncbi:reverse transcriptase-like protein [Candidatus Saccharibacteria bacterium]|nr:reverse transcriptase-like protein [Candidatus Saccharibacteria bacterium]MCA9337186.1 reverse transcriptase-like protein [Candidatus Saccharibacteria bacterium]
MKTLKFNHIEAENIRKGVQTATLRMKDEKNLSVDDTVAVIDKVHEDNQASWRVIGTATIDQVHVRRAGDIQMEGEGFEQFGSTTELYKQLEVFYGDPIDDATHIKIVHFTFHPYDKSKLVEDIDDKKTTNITEVKMFADGGSRGNPGPSASGYVLMDMHDTILETNGEYLNITTNNQAEYHSLKLGLERARQMGVRKVHVFMDSLLVINQMKGIFKVKNQELRAVFANVQSIVNDFEAVTFAHVPRERNKLADAEVNRILDSVVS